VDETTKVGEMAPEDQVKLWQNRVELGKRYQAKYGDVDGRWTKNIKALAGDFNSAAEIGPDAVDVHMVRSTVKTALPPLWITEPRIMVKPTTETFNGKDNIMRAENTEIEINYWLRELNVRHTVRKCIIDAHATNHGYAYLGYTKNKEDIEVDGEVQENVPTIRHRQPFIRRVSPKQVIVPPGYGELEEHPWVDIIFLKPFAHVRKKYPDTTADLKPTIKYADAAASDDTSSFSEYLENSESQLVEVHNVWDKETKKVYIFATDEDQYLEEPKAWPVEVEGFPMPELQFEYVPDEYHGTPPMSFSLTQNKELNITRSAMAKRRKQTKAVVFVASEIAESVKDQYARAEDGAIIPIDTGDKTMAQVIQVMPGLPADQGDLQYDAVIKSDIQLADGIGTEQRGSGDPNVDSATASQNIEKHAQVRGSDRGDLVRSFYLAIARKLWMILKQFPDQEVTRMVEGQRRGQFREVKYKLSDLRGEFGFDMDMSAMMADNPQTRVTQTILNYNLLRADPLVNPEQLLYDIFQAQNKPNPEAYLVFLRQPDEEATMWMSGLPVEAHERDNHQEHIAAHDNQTSKLRQGLEQFVEKMGLNSPQVQKLQLALALGMAHMNDHAMKLQKLQAASPRPAGQPVAENMLRNQVRAESGGETNAELSGQPLDQAGTVQ